MRSGWTVRPFDEVFDDVTSGHPKTLQGEYLTSGKFPVVDQGKALVAGYVNDESRLYRGPLPVIVFGDHTKCFKYVDFPFCIGADGTKILAPRDSADAKYLFHFLRQLRLPDGGYERHFKYLRRTQILLPPLEEQRRIAQVLDRAEALIALRRESLALLTTLIEAVFFEMFGVAGSNPRAWREAELGEFIEFGPQNGLYKPLSSYGSGTRILRIDSFYDGVVTDQAALKRVVVSDKERDVYGLQPGDLVISRVNSLEYLGKCALVPSLDEPTVFESNMMRIRVDPNRLHPRFLVQLWQSRYITSQILQKAKKAVQASINQKDVRSLRVIVPPVSLQRQFVHRVEYIEKLRTAQLASLAQLEALYASLQDRAFKGEL